MPGFFFFLFLRLLRESLRPIVYFSPSSLKYERREYLEDISNWIDDRVVDREKKERVENPERAIKYSSCEWKWRAGKNSIFQRWLNSRFSEEGGRKKIFYRAWKLTGRFIKTRAINICREKYRPVFNIRRPRLMMARAPVRTTLPNRIYTVLFRTELTYLFFSPPFCSPLKVLHGSE